MARFVQCCVWLAAAIGTLAQDVPGPPSPPPESSWPHAYPGKPMGDYSPAWQAYYEVTKMPSSVPNIGRNWAGSISVNRPHFPNDTLFFWGFEKTPGSMTSMGNKKDPWQIWLSGGPGSSSMTGLLWENGPIRISHNGSALVNKWSWHQLADAFWIDSPVGTGYSTVSEAGYVVDEDELASDFWAFVSNLVKVFPGLADRPLHINGESYAGVFIPYITKAYSSLVRPPAKLVKIAIGNAAIANTAQFQDATVTKILETYPALIGYDTEKFNYFVEQSHLCGFDLNLTYPQVGGKFPTLLNSVEQTTSSQKRSLARRSTRSLFDAARSAAQAVVERRDLNATYGCQLWNEMFDTVLTYRPFDDLQFWDIDYIPDGQDTVSFGDPTPFMNDPQVRAALHAPTSKNWSMFTSNIFQDRGESDPSVAPIAFFDELAMNLTKHGISIVLYSGNADAVVSHWSTEVVIQNTTFGGIQGFTRKPATNWYMDDGSLGGIVHQERNWTYALVANAGHLVPREQPELGFTLARDFIIGNERTGLVVSPNEPAVGGENAKLEGPGGDLIRGPDGILEGDYASPSTYLATSATIAAWNSFIATRWAAPATATSTATASP